MALDFRKLKILVVESDPAQAEALTGILQGFGVLRADHVTDAPSAVKLLKTGRLYDLMLCAFSLGAINGLSLVKAVRRDNRLTNRYTPIIMIAGRMPPERYAMIRAAGINELLSRPVSAHMLYGTIQAVLGRARPFVDTKNYFGPDRRQQQREGILGRRRGDSRFATPSPEDPWFL